MYAAHITSGVTFQYRGVKYVARQHARTVALTQHCMQVRINAVPVDGGSARTLKLGIYEIVEVVA